MRKQRKRQKQKLRKQRKRHSKYPCEIKQSNIPGAGMGVFATRDIEIGEIVGFYDGFYISDEDKIYLNMNGFEIECNGITEASVDINPEDIPDKIKLLTWPV